MASARSRSLPAGREDGPYSALGALSCAAITGASGSGFGAPEGRPVQLKANGQGGVEYPPITSQSIILIYRPRHGPASASSDIAQSMLFVRSCWAQVWSQGRAGGLASPACRQVEFGNHIPTEAEVDDSLFEVGGPVSRPFGRWTLAD